MASKDESKRASAMMTLKGCELVWPSDIQLYHALIPGFARYVRMHHVRMTSASDCQVVPTILMMRGCFFVMGAFLIV